MAEVSDTLAWPLRPSWVAAVVDVSQAAAGKIVLAEADEARAILEAFVDTLPPPATEVESRMLRGVLLEMASRTGPQIHRYAHLSNCRDCGFVPGAVIERFWSVPNDSPQGAFRRWMDEFFARLGRSHPQSPASRTARLLGEEYQIPWAIPTLAQRVHQTPAQLSRQFRLEFDLSIPDYQRIVRLIHALDLVRYDKAEAVALEVGYKSKKNFYATLKRFTGLTPRRFRQLSTARAAELVEFLRLSLRKHGPATDAGNERHRSRGTMQPIPR
jgi:AraC-like DNA-binding protein